MPRQSRGPRLWWRKDRRKGRKVFARGTWLLIDRGQHHPTGCFAGEDRQAQEFLAAYIAEKYSPERRLKDIESIDVADVLSVYDEDSRGRQANKAKFDERLARLAKWWGGKMLSDVTGVNCRAYTKFRGSNGGARRDCAYRGRRPRCPAHGDHVIRSMTTGRRTSLMAPLDLFSDLSI